MKKFVFFVLIFLVISIQLNILATTQNIYPVRWWVNGNGYTGFLIFSVNPSNNKLQGTLLGTPVEGYLIGRHIILYRFPSGDRQVWDGWIMERKLGSSIPSYNSDYFISGTISMPGGSLYPWFAMENKKIAGVPGNSGNYLNQGKLINGNFESYGKNISRWVTLSRGSNQLKGWKIEKGSIDLIGSYWRSNNGNNSIDLCGSSCGSISQEINTIPGKIYELSFDLSGNWNHSGKKVLIVKANNTGKRFIFDTAGMNGSNMRWVRKKLVFKATSTTTKISFIAPDALNDPYCGPVIDNVTLKILN